VLHLHVVIGLPLVLTRLADSAKEVQVEQGVKAHPLLGMRRKRCGRGLAHMFDGARAEQLYGLKEAHRLLGGDRKPVFAQQYRKADQRAPRSGHLHAHAAIPGMNCARRGRRWARSSSSLIAAPRERRNASGQDAPVRASAVAASAQSTASATPGGFESGSL